MLRVMPPDGPEIANPGQETRTTTGLVVTPGSSHPPGTLRREKVNSRRKRVLGRAGRTHNFVISTNCAIPRAAAAKFGWGFKLSYAA